MTDRANNTILPEIEEFANDTVAGALAGRIPLLRGSAVWDNPELPRKTFRTVEINPFQLQRSLVTSPQTGGESIAVGFYDASNIAKYLLQQIFIPEIIKISGSSQIEETTTEKDYRWVCSIAEKTTPHSRVSYLLPYAFLTEKQESFSPDFHDIRNMARLLLQPASTQLEDEIPEILVVSEASQVIEEAKAEKIELDLEIAIGLIRKIYTTLKEIKLSVKYDPEITGRKTFCFDLTVSGGVDTILKDESLFKQNLLSNVSDRACELIVIAYDWER